MRIPIVLAAASVAAAGASAHAGAIMTGIMDGDLSGGAPKAIELYVDGTVDFAGWDLARSSNGGAFTTTSDLSALGIVTDSFVYLVGSAGAGITDFEGVFGTSGDFANTFLIGVVSGNGNDAFQLLDAGDVVVDQYGNPAEVPGGSSDYSAPWAYQDSWGYRNDSTGPDGGWVLGNWSFGGNGALDGLDAGQQGAAVPFGTYVPAPGAVALLGLGGLAAARRRRA